MKILGIDPGLLNLGCVLLKIGDRDFEILRAETLKPKRNLELSKKLFYLYQNLKEFIKEENPDYIILEEVIPKANPSSTAKLSQAQALVLLISEEKKIPVKIYHPSYWKAYLCGNGLAEKEKIYFTLKRLFGEKIDDKIRNSHLADAMAISLVFAMENNIFKI